MTAADIEAMKAEWLFDFRQRVDKEKFKRGLKTDKQVAELIGVNPVYVSRALNGVDDKTSRDVRGKIMTVFNIDDL